MPAKRGYSNEQLDAEAMRLFIRSQMEKFDAESVAELAHKTRTDYSLLNRMWNGNVQNMTAKNIMKLARAFGVNPHDILTALTGQGVDGLNPSERVLLSAFRQIGQVGQEMILDYILKNQKGR